MFPHHFGLVSYRALREGVGSVNRVLIRMPKLAGKCNGILNFSKHKVLRVDVNRIGITLSLFKPQCCINNMAKDN